MSPFRDFPFRFALSLTFAAALAACGGGNTDSAPIDSLEQETASDTDPITEALVDDGDTVQITTDTVDGDAATIVAGVSVTAATEPSTTATSTESLAVRVDTRLMPTRATGYSVDRVKASTLTTNASNIGAFRTTCAFSHMAPDDPIVFPNQPGRSHLHTFFGNTGANAYSTATSIATTGNSTCHGGTANRSAYWVPTMIDTRNGAPIKPVGSMIYYKTGYNGILPSQVRPFPAGLRMIAGNAKNAAPKGPFRYVCVGKGSSSMTGYGIQNCPAGAQMWQQVFFPQCWDGVNLDSPDHKSHMSYTVKRACPATHPVPLPEITFNIRYAVAETNAPLHWRLSSDTYDRTLPAGYSAHGDWFNGWKQDIMKTYVQKCDQGSRDCHANLLGDGRLMY